MRMMNIQMKRLLAVVLAVMVAVSFMPFTAVESFASTGGALTLTLEDDQTTFKEGESIFVKATGSATGAWVGMYKKGDVKDPYAGGVSSYRWYTVAEYDGTAVDITKQIFAQGNTRGDLDPGEYEIALFGDGGYENIIETIYVTIIVDPNKKPDTPSDQLTLKLEDESKTSYLLGEPIQVRATGTAEGAWVGLYKAGSIVDPDNGGVVSYRWYYVQGRNGKPVDITSAEFDSNSMGSLEEGDYEVILFGDSGYENIAARVSFTIAGKIVIDPNQFTLEADKAVYKYGDPIKVKATGTGIGNGAWVGLYDAEVTKYNSSYLYYYYVRDYEGMFTTMQRKIAGVAVEKNIAQGNYRLVIFADGGYDFPVKTLDITIERDVKTRKVMRDPACNTFGLEYVEYLDGASEYREIPVLGHSWGTASHVKGTTTHKFVCQRSLCEKEKVENCTYGAAKVTKATLKTAGKKTYTCTVCGGKKTETIAKLKAAPKLASTKLVYNGKNRKPSVKKIYNSKGQIVASKNYTVTYPKTAKNVGTYKVTVKFKGNYKGTYVLKYQIVPKAVQLKSLKKGSKSIKVSWKKASGQTTGYQIAYSVNKNFKNAKYKKINKVKTTSTKLTKLKAKKKYYVKVRAYKKVNGKTYYASWSKTKNVTTK